MAPKPISSEQETPVQAGAGAVPEGGKDSAAGLHVVGDKPAAVPPDAPSMFVFDVDARIDA